MFRTFVPRSEAHGEVPGAPILKPGEKANAIKRLEIATWHYFPRRLNITICVFAQFVAGFGLWKLTKGLRQPQKPKPAPPVVPSTGTGPTIATFDQWARDPANWQAWERSLQSKH